MALNQIKNETVNVLKDFSSKEAIRENSKKMHPLRVFAMVFIIFTLVLNIAATAFTVINGWTSGHDYDFGKGLEHISATFNYEAILITLAALAFSLVYLIRAYKCKGFTWIPALFIPIVAFASLFYTTQHLSWYGMGADIAKGCANFSAILSLPTIFLELSVTGQSQKAGGAIQNFFISLKNENIHILRIVGIGLAILALLVQQIGLLFIALEDTLEAIPMESSILFFTAAILALILYVLFIKRRFKFAVICPVAFVALNAFVPTADFRNAVLVISGSFLVLEIITLILTREKKSA
ncbi:MULTISPECIES: hypothetical protein [unclassified Fibrobacter]|uniref:hypothetical protein n=1 Tax=unclassified Fibrobacter TaxID=2634177 RepID=UPI000D6BEE31|nr:MULTISPECIES: hypothetical protein [unclassified Fibrobacter]PWJ69975.1 hypothetical protein BGX12_10455 [Fibrobacter sp. UWR4]PZW73146.1 hypothetical protein C8E88_100455 [Fibrobacter sp. UWR1]